MWMTCLLLKLSTKDLEAAISYLYHIVKFFYNTKIRSSPTYSRKKIYTYLRTQKQRGVWLTLDLMLERRGTPKQRRSRPSYFFFFCGRIILIKIVKN
jgi:hypothetical protein